MSDFYTADDLEGLEQRVSELTEDYGLTETVETAIYNIWESALASNANDFEYLQDTMLERHASAITGEETSEEQEIYADVRGLNWMEEEPRNREPFKKLTDKEKQDKSTNYTKKLARLGARDAALLETALGGLE